MAWNPSPKVADCREIARKWGHKQVIIIAINHQTDKMEMATYGDTKVLCSTTKYLGDRAYRAVWNALAEE